MPGRVTHKLDNAAVRELLSGSRGAVARDLYRRGRRVEAKAKRLCPVDTGRLRSSISTEVLLVAGRPIIRVGTNVEYALAVHEGHRAIVPVRAKVLRFRLKGRGTWIFRPRVRAVRGVPFLKNALPAAHD